LAALARTIHGQAARDHDRAGGQLALSQEGAGLEATAANSFDMRSPAAPSLATPVKLAL